MWNHAATVKPAMPVREFPFGIAVEIQRSRDLAEFGNPDRSIPSDPHCPEHGDGHFEGARCSCPPATSCATAQGSFLARELYHLATRWKREDNRNGDDLFALLSRAALVGPAQGASAQPTPATDRDIQVALHQAAAGLYIAHDAADYEAALWGVIKALDPSLVGKPTGEVYGETVRRTGGGIKPQLADDEEEV